MMEISNIYGAVIISKIDDKYKVKMRSDGRVNVKLLLEEYGGGGHMSQAAGILSEKNKELLINDIIKYEGEL